LHAHDIVNVGISKMRSKNGPQRRRLAPILASATAAAVLGWLLVSWQSPPPQIGADEEVSQAVDALFTAVTARDEKLLSDCHARLLALGDAGKLPADASTYLGKVVGKARAGRWESAARTLYEFVRAQRRERASIGA
jgi:hypothetical protein